MPRFCELNGSSPSVALISLGCPKNLVDSEVMLGRLLTEGARVVDDPDQADALIINTCAFIDSAQEESVDAILEAAARRDALRPDQAIIVAGCLSQRYQERLAELLPEVDLFIGVDETPRIAAMTREALRRRARARAGGEKGEGRVRIGGRPPQFVPDASAPRLQLTPPHFAYLKIAEGCNHPCSFCVIPRIRGPYRSRPLEDVVKEAARLVANGVRELNLISQDTTFYGADLPGQGASLASLLRRLDRLPGEFWIRTLYTHPAHWTEELIDAFAECRKTVPYVDVPFQHSHDAILKRMRRRSSRAQIEALIARLRERIPDLTLRTTFIVGFPGETEEMVRDLIDFVRHHRFERVGVFTYSQEEGTPAARMPRQIPDAEKQRRREAVMAAQREVVAALHEAQQGRTLTALAERTHEDARRLLLAAVREGREEGKAGRALLDRLEGPITEARGPGDAPDVDERIYVAGALPAGEFVEVRITGSADYDLLAEPLAAPLSANQ